MLVDPKRVVVVMWCSALCINMCRSLYRYEAKADLRTEDFSSYIIKEKCLINSIVVHLFLADISLSGH